MAANNPLNGNGPFPPGPGPFPPPPPSPPPSHIPDGPASTWDVNQINEFLTGLKNFGKQDTVRQIELIRAVQELKEVYTSESQQRVVKDFLKRLDESEKWNNFNLSKLRDDLKPAKRAAQKQATENYIERIKVELKASGIEASDENINKWLQTEKAQQELTDLTEKTLDYLASKDEDLAKTLAEYKETQSKLSDFIDWRKKIELAKSADSGFNTLLGVLRNTATGDNVDPELLKLAHQQINVLSGLRQGFEEYSQRLDDQYMANERSIRMLWHGLPQAIGQKLQNVEGKFTEMFGPELTQTIKFGTRIAQSAGRVLANPRTSINASKETIAQIKEATTSVFSNPRAVVKNLRSGLGIDASEAMQRKALAYQERSAKIEAKRLPVEAKRDLELTELAKHGLQRGSIYTHDIHLEKILKKGFDWFGAYTGLTKKTIDQIGSMADPLVNFLEDTDDGLRLRADTVVGAKIAGRSLLLTLFAAYDWLAKSKASQSAAWRQNRMITLLESIETSLRLANSLSWEEQRRRRLQKRKGNDFIDKVYFGALNGIRKMAGKGIAAVGAAFGIKRLADAGKNIARPIRRSLGGGQRITAFSHILRNLKGGIALTAVAGTLYAGHKWASRIDEKSNRGMRAGEKRINDINAAIAKLDSKIEKSWSNSWKEKYRKQKEALEEEKQKIEANKATTADKVLAGTGAVAAAGAITLGAGKIGTARDIAKAAAERGLTVAEYKALNPGVGKGIFGMLKSAKISGVLGAAFTAHTIFNAATDATKSREEKTEAIAGAIGSSVGSVVGGILGSAIPGWGTIVGSMLGGWIGDWIGKKFAPYVLKAWDAIMKPLRPVVRLITIFFTRTKKFWEGMWEIVKGISLGIWESVKMLWDGLKDVFSGFWDIITAPFKAIWSFFKSMFSGIMDIIDGIADLFENPSEKLWESLKKIGIGLLKIAAAPFKALWVLIKGLAKGFWSLIKGVGKILAAPFVGLWEIIKGLGKGLLKIGSFAWDIIKGLGKFIFVTLPLLILKGLKGLFIDLPILIVKLLWKGLVWLVTDLPKLIFKGIKAVFIDLPGLIWKWLLSGLNWLVKLPGKLIGMAWDWLFGSSDSSNEGGLWNWVKDKIAGFWNWITTPFRAMTDWIADKIAWLGEKLGPIVDVVLAPFKVLGEIFDWIGSKLKWFWDVITSPFETIKKIIDWIKEKLGWIAHPIESAKKAAGAVIDGAKDLAKKATEKVSGWWESAKGWFSGSKKVVEATKEKAKEVVKTTVEKSSEVVTAVKEKTKDFAEAAKDVSSGVASKAKNLTQSTGKALSHAAFSSMIAIQNAASTTKEKLQPAIDVTVDATAKIVESTSAAIEKKKEKISKSANNLGSHISDAVEATKETTAKIADKTKKVASDTAFYSGVAIDATKDLKELGLKDTIKATKTGLKLYHGQLSEITADEFRAASKVGGIGIKASLKVVWKKIKDKAKSIWSKVTGFFKAPFDPKVQQEAMEQIKRNNPFTKLKEKFASIKEKIISFFGFGKKSGQESLVDPLIKLHEEQKEKRKTSIWEAIKNKASKFSFTGIASALFPGHLFAASQKTASGALNKKDEISPSNLEETKQILGTKPISTVSPAAEGSKQIKEEVDKTLNEKNPVGAALLENTRRSEAIAKSLEEMATALKATNASPNVSVSSQSSSKDAPYREIPSDIDSLGILITNKIWGVAN